MKKSKTKINKPASKAREKRVALSSPVLMKSLDILMAGADKSNPPDRVPLSEVLKRMREGKDL